MNFIKLFTTLFSCVVIALLCHSCSDASRVPSEFIGKWECQINRYQKIELNISKDGKFKYTIYQSNERYDAIYEGDIVVVNENIIKLPSSQYTKRFNNNRRDSDPVWQFVTVNTTYFLRNDGAFSKTESGLDRPLCDLKKIE